MTNELALMEEKDLTIHREPSVVLEEAKRAAKALSDVISGKKKPVIINNEQYLEFEDWMTVARFYGITAKVISTAPISFGDVHGFEARAVAILVQTGEEISAAEAMCLNDESNWKSRPLFMLRSMAQTRACAKALRNVLSWVVVLAGYKSTPAEEMQELNGKQPIKEPQKKTGDVPKDRPKGEIATITIKDLRKQEKKKDGTPMKSPLYIITSDAGVDYKTFSESIVKIANKERNSGIELQVEYKKDSFGNTILDDGLSYAQQPPEDENAQT
jgi:hypothetical protein